MKFKYKLPLAVIITFGTLFSLPSNAKDIRNYNNSEFYKSDNSLDTEKLKQAYYDLMTYHDYPIYNNLKTDQFWVCDFLQANVKDVGMGGVFWMNVKNTYEKAGTRSYKGDFSKNKFGYLGHDIYLLPNQAIPEHHHLGGSEDFGPKMESWFVRHGDVRFFSEYASTGEEYLISELPEGEWPWGYGEAWFKAKYYIDKKEGETYNLSDPESYHFVRAKTEGAIITEFATYHNAVSFSKPRMEFKNTEAK